MRSLVELLSRFFPTDRLTDPEPTETQPTAATANSSDSQAG
ncbi:hypothetical protein QT970_15065 [Microcoleus sp. herbarium8]